MLIGREALLFELTLDNDIRDADGNVKEDVDVGVDSDGIVFEMMDGIVWVKARVTHDVRNINKGRIICLKNFRKVLLLN